MSVKRFIIIIYTCKFIQIDSRILKKTLYKKHTTQKIRLKIAKKVQDRPKSKELKKLTSP